MNNYFADLPESYIIAEIGVNHNGSIDFAKKLIDAALLAGANAVKFQTFTAKNLVMKGTPKVPYQNNNQAPNENHYEMLKRLELSKSNHIELFDYCKKSKIDFISTPYDVESAQFLNDLGVSIFKTASADIVDLLLHKYISSTGKPTIIATGMSTISDINHAVKIYSANYNLCLLHCVSNYPCTDASLNLNSLATLASAFNLPIGLSDHSDGNLAASLAIALGAKVIEKHFTLDKTLSGPDHKASSTPLEFSNMVKSLRRAELMLGSSLKVVQSEEKDMLKTSRKSIVLKHNLNAGSRLKINDLILKRPGNGISPIHIFNIIGKKIKFDLQKEKQLMWEDLED